MQIHATLRSIVQGVVDYALPPRCPGCGCIVEDDHRFCVECWSGLHFLSEPCCATCGEPFDMDQGEGALCGRCLSHPPLYDSARAVLAYGDHARDVAMRLKYGRRMAMARLMAQHMAQRLPHGAVADDDWLIVPVPLHRWRLWGRGFNQAAVIADHIGRKAGIGVEKRALIRHRSTRPLRDMNPDQRASAVKGAFALDHRFGGAIKGRNILLIDDIHTSGATSGACTRALRSGGARSVHLLCWARVIGRH
jgi:ComF family protein